ncbi:hypothetical protein L596_020901 [Steinernema carpocapsae]|uniref:Uncharacterized protein n=1 Tax=Steinernema carpocapsae TaxID=34508 RepID=A0A4U5MV34_STECR|nr:hypothetical protein L596_020901 [Steinernema carpocapsae]
MYGGNSDSFGHHHHHHHVRDGSQERPPYPERDGYRGYPDGNVQIGQGAGFESGFGEGQQHGGIGQGAGFEPGYRGEEQVHIGDGAGFPSHNKGYGYPPFPAVSFKKVQVKMLVKNIGSAVVISILISPALKCLYLLHKRSQSQVQASS